MAKTTFKRKDKPNGWSRVVVLLRLTRLTGFHFWKEQSSDIVTIFRQISQ